MATNRWRLARTLVGYTATASSEIAEQPASNVKRYTEPFAAWQQGESGDQWLRFDLGQTTALSGIFVNNTNATSFVVEQSANGSTWPYIGTFLTGIDTRAGMRRMYADISGFSNRYLRLRMLETALDPGWGQGGWGVGGWPGNAAIGPAFYVGTVALLHPITSLSRPPLRPGGYRRVQPQVVTDFLAGAGFEVDDIGRPYLEATLTLRTDKNLTEAEEWALITPGQPFVLIEDFGDPARAVLLRRVANDARRETFVQIERDGLLLREAV